MNREHIFPVVTGIIRDVLDLPDLALSAATSAENVEAWDSFNHIYIVLAVEAHFGVKFHTTEIEEIRNVGELVDLIDRKLNARKPD